MARPLRLEFAGTLYHITSRGDGREDIFLSDDDRLIWLETLAQVCQRFNWVCLAYRRRECALGDKVEYRQARMQCRVIARETRRSAKL